MDRVLLVPLLAVFGDIGEADKPLSGLPVQLEGGGRIANDTVDEDQRPPDQRTPPSTPPCPLASRWRGKRGGVAETTADGATATQQSTRGGARNTTIYLGGRCRDGGSRRRGRDGDDRSDGRRHCLFLVGQQRREVKAATFVPEAERPSHERRQNA